MPSTRCVARARTPEHQDSNMKELVPCILLAFAFLLLPRETLQDFFCSKAPSSLSLTTELCGQSTSTGSTEFAWLTRPWTRFVGPTMGLMVRPDSLLVGGSPAAISEAPFIAYIEASYPDGTGDGCAGSIISDMWIVTAGHCIYNSNKSAEIILGRTL
ncbi:unnamed protein product [Darwinula stevensoni]|uniref:Peptidase S1 domain-containing protein n=1 Tax=Darwinula stevensoni TaxID=69355 RepID=A0A7R8XB06_9CRUS|nr:unnamed protein product [Darwinula stevensoni]CAG0891128.1 unnamed protein product [Darwinula stevensoni]